MRIVLVAALAALAGAACAGELSPHQRAVEQQILEDRLASWTRLMNNQALDSLGQSYRHDSTLTATGPDGRRSRGWIEHEAALRAMFQAVSTLNLVVQDPHIDLLSSDVAVVTFRYSMDQILRNELRDVFAGRGTQVWVRDHGAGRWVIAASHLARTPTGPTARPLQP